MAEDRGYIRTGFRTVTPYLMVQGAEGLIAFALAAFDAEEVRRDLRPDGGIMNAELRIGDSVVELAEAREEWQARPAALHVYVRDTDATYRRALAVGATELYAPAEMPYGERSAGVADPSGTQWFIATFRGEQ